MYKYIQRLALTDFTPTPVTPTAVILANKVLFGAHIVLFLANKVVITHLFLLAKKKDFGQIKWNIGQIH